MLFEENKASHRTSRKETPAEQHICSRRLQSNHAHLLTLDEEENVDEVRTVDDDSKLRHGPNLMVAIVELCVEIDRGLICTTFWVAR